MARSIDDTVLDAALNDLKTNVNQIVLCEGQPLTYAEATTLKSAAGKKLASIAVVSTDFTIANGDVSGRKVTLAGKSGTVTESGNYDHIAWVDTVNLVLKNVSVGTLQALTAANPVNTPAHKFEIKDPTA